MRDTTKKSFGRDVIAALSAQLGEQDGKEPERATTKTAAIESLLPKILKLREQRWKWREIAAVLEGGGMAITGPSLSSLVAHATERVPGAREQSRHTQLESSGNRQNVRPAPRAANAVTKAHSKIGPDETIPAPSTNQQARGGGTAPPPATDVIARAVATMHSVESSRQRTALRGSFAVAEDREDL